jgi:flagellar basal-body rod protein FlgB
MKMFLDRIFDSTFNGLNKSLELTWRRNEAITSNVSNAETPQYRAVDVDFGHELDKAFGAQQQQLEMTNPAHLDLGQPEGAHLKSDLSGATKPDGNNVDIDIQMGKLAYNSGQYSIATNLMRKKLSLLGNAIRQAIS